jgi:hypothetical protein
MTIMQEDLFVEEGWWSKQNLYKINVWRSKKISFFLTLFFAEYSFPGSFNYLPATASHVNFSKWLNELLPVYP